MRTSGLRLMHKGHVVLAHGRSEFIEKYVEVIGLLLEMGWSVSRWTGEAGLNPFTPQPPQRAH